MERPKVDTDYQETGVFFHGPYGEVFFLFEELPKAARGTRVDVVRVLWNTPWYAYFVTGIRKLDWSGSEDWNWALGRRYNSRAN